LGVCHSLWGAIVITKRQLLMSQWGSYRDDQSISDFHPAIMLSKPPPNLVTRYDTQLANAVVANNDVWTKNIHYAVHNTSLQHPLQNPITIMQIFHEAHYTTMITDNNKYYHYVSLRLPIPYPVNKLHTRLMTWYAQTPLPDSLAPEIPYITTSYTPQ